MMIDFNHMNETWTKRNINKNHLLARAVSLHKHSHLDILDATAGLARDAFILAKLGATVTMVERHPDLADAIQHAIDTCLDAAIQSRLHCYHQDSQLFLSICSSYDIIYLDPMFPHDKRTARVKKDLQSLQKLVGNDPDSPMLLGLAKEKAKKRVVVKRHKQSAYLANDPPHFSMIGQSTRYDVYLVNP